MKVLVIGSGGREHALVWKLSQSPRMKKIFCAPGNGGIVRLAECVAISPQNIPQLIEFTKKQAIDLTIVGPELPLSLGIVDEFEKEDLKIFGPAKNAALIESSKCFAKEFCTRYQIPTAPYDLIHSSIEAKKLIDKKAKYPIVVKADGLAAGKGVIIAHNREEALQAVEDILVYEKFGDVGRTVIFEEFMEGEEATFMVISDGEDFLPLATSQDHKRVFDEDKGPNTGGMGAYSPAPVVTPEIEEQVLQKIIAPFIRGMKEEERPYRGILYAGLMIHKGQARVVEFNCRFGDPEAQAILYRLESDLVDLIEAALKGKIAEEKINFTPQPAVCVVMSAQGYPGSYETGKVISGLETAESIKNAFVFHAGTRIEGGKYLSNGGRVLGVTARGKDLKKAIKKVYQVVEKISWDGVFYRKDIGKKGLL